ncbi:MAG: DUF4435 domain-containing protein [Candidatus Methanomethylophilaceae archaeon]
MREYLEPKDIANNISMLKTAFDGTIVAVEGITDRRLYGKFLDNENVEVVIAHSKDNVRSAVSEVYNMRGCRKIIGIMDADLDHILNKKRNPPLFLTDTRDNETLMLKSNALEDVLYEYGDKNAIDRFSDEYGPIRDVVLDSCYPLGLLMYVSEKEGFGLCFRDLNYELFIDKRTLRCDVKKMIDEVQNNTRSPTKDVRSIRMSLEKELREEKDPWLICRGHDALAVMAIGLRNIFGAYNSRYIKDGELSGAFRLAYDREDMIRTKLYKETESWCSDKNIHLWSFT